MPDHPFWIEIPDDEATPELSRLTKSWRDQGRKVPGVVGAMKPSPKTFKAVLRLNDAVTFGGSVLGRRREELAAAAVSALNDCFY